MGLIIPLLGCLQRLCVTESVGPVPAHGFDHAGIAAGAVLEERFPALRFRQTARGCDCRQPLLV